MKLKASRQARSERAREHRHQRAVIGVDVGGTEVKGVLCSALGVIGDPVRRRNRLPGDSGGVMSTIEEVSAVLLERAGELGIEVHAAGLAIPGHVDASSGVCRFSANLDWGDLAPGPDLEAALGLRVHVEHDVYSGALAEFTSGAGRGIRSGAFVAIGSGVAATLFMKGQFWRGVSRYAGEIGHVRRRERGEGEQCGCGRLGCIELGASVRGLQRSYAQARGIRNESAPVVEAKEISRRAAGGEAAAQTAWDQFVKALAEALALLTLTVDLDRIVIGGGLSESGSRLLSPLADELVRELAPLRAAPELRLARFGQLAGARGAALHALGAELGITVAEPEYDAAGVPRQRPHADREVTLMVAFDHRSSTAAGLFGTSRISDEQWERLAEAKVLVAQAVAQARLELSSVGEVSLLVDPQSGMAAARVSVAAGTKTALALEVSGQRTLRLLDESLLREAVAELAASVRLEAPSTGSLCWGKVLVRWNPADPTETKDANLAGLDDARRFCESAGMDLLLELIVPPTEADLACVRGDRSLYKQQSLPTLLPASVAELTRRSGPPSCWKLEGLASPVAAAAVAEAACHGRTTPPILVLGGGAERTQLAGWFRAGAGVESYAGFAIGRGIWREPVADWIAGRMDDDQVHRAVIDRLHALADDYVVANTVSRMTDPEAPAAKWLATSP